MTNDKEMFQNRYIKSNFAQSPAIKTLPIKIVIPVVLTIILFILTIYLVMIPLIEKNMMDMKRQGIKQLTESAYSALASFYAKPENQQLSTKEAQFQAIRHLKQLRYGPEQADYFWINDMIPVMIMHPYRPDLVGKNVSDFKDPGGNLLFQQMLDVVKKNGEGFVDYIWQWKDNPNKVAPKISYVKEFKPWGWIIGTGIYVQDVKEEIRAITHKVTATCSGILFLFILLSGNIVWQSVKAKKEQMAAVEQTRLKEKQLIQADKMTSLGILVAGVAHEVNNPITSIMLNAPSLKKAWLSFEPIIESHFKDQPDTMVCNMPYAELIRRMDMMLTGMEDSAGRVKKIITELKDFSRPSKTDMSQEIDINEMVNKSLDLTRSLLKKSTHYLFVSPANKLPAVKGDIQKLQQVVINLIVNACQALESPSQSINVRTAWSDEKKSVAIIVADSGPGLTPEQLAKIKDPFFTTKRDEGGTGLGLSICEKIVNDHNGVLEFESSPGQGLTATLILPAVEQERKENRS